MKRAVFLMLFIFTLQMISCSKSRSTSENQTKESKKIHYIAVSIPPQKYFLEQLLDTTKYKIVSFLKEGESPATFSPSPKRIKQIAQSEVYVKIFVPFENAYWNNIKSINPKIKEIISYPPEKKIGNDPHVWLSPKRVIEMVGIIRDSLVKFYPEDSILINNRYKSFLDSLTSLDSIITNKLKPYSKHRFIIFHPNLTYYAKDYNITQVSIEVMGKSVTPNRLKEIINIAKQDSIHYIIIQKEFDYKVVEGILKDINGKEVVIRPMNPDWKNNMLYITNILVKIFKNEDIK